MKYGIAVGYLVAAIISGVWMEAIDNRFGLAPEAPNNWFMNTLAAAAWPVFVPATMAAIACGGWGRWTKLPHAST